MRIVNSEVSFFRTVDGKKQGRGYEQQRYVFQDDGTLTVNAFSVATDRDIVRDLILNYDVNMRPVDSYVRIHRRDRLEGSAWYRFGDEDVDADILNVDRGVVHDHLHLGGRVSAFEAHSICCDVLMAAGFDRASEARVQQLSHTVMSSADPFGAVGPHIAPVTIQIEYVGAEITTTPAGDFETDHWRLIPHKPDDGTDHPDMDLWSMRGSYVFARAEIAAIGYVYELTRHQEMRL